MKSKEEIYHEELGTVAKGCHEVVRDAILRAMEAYASQDRWISAEERLPEKEKNARDVSVDVLAFGGIWEFSAYYNFAAKRWRQISPRGMCSAPEVTHWQPLPAPPKTQS